MNYKSINELEDCCIKYFNQSTEFISFGNSTDFANDFAANWNQIVFRDNPDGYLVINDRVIIIEHFEYDATKWNKKGSETRRENFRINKEFKDLDNQTHGTKLIHKQMNVTHSTENLRDNFVKVFTEHNSKISQYKKQLINDGIIKNNSDVVVMFCCEDKTTFGCLAYDDNRYYSFNVIDIKECLDVVLKSNVNYLLLCNPYQNDTQMFLLPVSNEILKISKNKLASEIKMIDFTPQVIGASVFIPKK